MLPTERARSLAEKAVLVAVRKADPECEALRKEFDARATAWAIVLDARGELLDGGPADPTGVLKKKDSSEFPELFVAAIQKSLQRKESLQDLQRRWEKDPLDEASYRSLASRLDELKSHARLRELCGRVSALPGLPDDRRAEALLRGYIAGPSQFGALDTPEAQDRFAREGEQLIADHPAHPKAAEAVQALFTAGYGHRFDVPARSAEGIARLNARAQSLKDPGPLRQRIAELSGLRDKEIARLEAARSAARGNEASEAWYARALGDAEMTVRVFSKPPHDKSAWYQAWVREAREKLQRQNEKPALGEK